jgi:hypothetical protein
MISSYDLASRGSEQTTTQKVAQRSSSFQGKKRESSTSTRVLCRSTIPLVRGVAGLRLHSIRHRYQHQPLRQTRPATHAPSFAGRLRLGPRLRGVYFVPGVPNTTHVTQETDQNYGPFKTIYFHNLEILVKSRYARNMTLSVADIPLLIFGGGKMGMWCWRMRLPKRSPPKEILPSGSKSGPSR